MASSWTCSTGKSNPNTSQICLSALPALQHCFWPQAGLGEQCPCGQHSSCPPSLPPWAPCTQAKAPTGIPRAHTEEKVFLHFAECCGLGKAGWNAGKNLVFYIINWMNMYPWQVESQGAEIFSFLQWVLLLLHTSKEFCCSHFIWLRHKSPREGFCHQNHQFAFNHSSSHLNNMTCQKGRNLAQMYKLWKITSTCQPVREKLQQNQSPDTRALVGVWAGSGCSHCRRCPHCSFAPCWAQGTLITGCGGPSAPWPFPSPAATITEQKRIDLKALCEFMQSETEDTDINRC